MAFTSRSRSGELAPFGITVNMVSPGWIPVERHENDSQESKDGYRALIPADRWGLPADVGGIVTFLAILELLRLGMITVWQSRRFGEIRVGRGMRPAGDSPPTEV